jgi:hypothetical protein
MKLDAKAKNVRFLQLMATLTIIEKLISTKYSKFGTFI